MAEELTLPAFINGKNYTTNDWYEIISPLTLKPLGKVPALKPADLDLAFEAASKAQTNWAQTSILTRIKVIEAWKQALHDHRQELALLMAKEIGKAVKSALSEVDRTVELIDQTILAAKTMTEEVRFGAAANKPSKWQVITRVPKGVVLAISPFNYPVNLSLAKLIPALLMGNTVVFKAATNGTLTASQLIQLSKPCGFPAGVINFVTGRGRDIGDDLLAHSAIKVVSFTGSVPVGERMAHQTGMIDLILELGGKDPAIVTSKADLKLAAQEIVKGAFSYSGQRCTAIKRVIVADQVADQLIAELKPLVTKLTVGSALDNCDITPLINLKAAQYNEELFNEAITAGAVAVTPFKRNQNLVWPTLVDLVQPTMRLAVEEQFGPVLPIIRVKSLSAAVAIANDSIFGLQASVFTTDLNEAHQLATMVDAGSVNINGRSERGPDTFVFLGTKKSGLNQQGIKESLLSMSRPKPIVFNWSPINL